ncbi:MAG: dTMP kinase [Thermotogaceae bacterium]|nr:dTMP kinase [Thermotogaceae bacterium]MDN5337867.1 dTMP kinase [Thermotogaceae bacterium]
MVKSLMPFISFEGIDASGKSTQINLLCEFLKKKEIDFLVVREPGGTSIGEKVREILLSPESHMFPETEFLLYAASRAQLVREKILPALKDKKFVIADRFADSSVAYQGFGRGIGIDKIDSINNFATLNIVPDITFIIDIPVEVSLQRKAEKRDRIELEKREFIEKVREGYHVLSKDPRFVLIDGNRDIMEVHHDIVNILKERKII